MPEARFPESHIYLPELEMVVFAAIVGQNAIGCSISSKTLSKLFGRNRQPLDCFKQNRPVIEKLAEKFILQRRFEGGLVVIRDCDIQS